MKKLEENQQVTQLTLELTSLDQTFRDPKFKGLIDQGYRIAQIIPVEDQGRPMGIFIFQPPVENKTNELIEKYGKMVAVYLFLLSILITTLTIKLFTGA